MTEKECHEYFKKARKHLLCDEKQKLLFEKQMRAAIEDLKNENPAITYEECISIIGTPEEAAESFLSTLSPEMIAAYRCKKCRITWLIRIVAVVLIVVLGAAALYMYTSKKWRVIEAETTIVELGDIDIEDIPNYLE